MHVADQSLEVERIEANLTRAGIDQLVIQDDRDIKRWVAGKAEAGCLVAGVKLIKDQVKPFQALVSILGSVIDAVIVIPQGAQRFVDVTVGLMRRGKTGLLCGEVVIEILSAEEPSAGPAITLRRSVEIVQVGRHLRHAEATILALRRQFIESANQPRFLIVTDNGGPRERSHVARSRTTQVISPD